MIAGALASLATLFVACAQTTHARPYPQSQDGFVFGTHALWSRTISGGEAVGIYGATVVIRTENGIEGLDARTAARLWKRKESKGSFALGGSQLFLVVGSTIELLDARTGASKWRSAPLCRVPRKVPSYTTILGTRLYVGCTGGEIFALAPSTGHVLASARPVILDNYDQMIRLGRNTMGIAGKASGAFMFRRSAIVNRDTLSTVVAFSPDVSFIGVRNGEALVADTCCQGLHSDTWPATIERVSLANGNITSNTSLHPYGQPLPLDKDQPGPGKLLLVGHSLYVATHSALFAYDLADLRARPRILYDDMLDLPQIIDNRYLLVRMGEKGVQRRVALLDARADMRELWSTSTSAWMPSGFWTPRQGPSLSLETSVNGRRVAKIISLHNWQELQIDGDCQLSISSSRYALTYCWSPPRPARMQMYTFGARTASRSVGGGGR